MSYSENQSSRFVSLPPEMWGALDQAASEEKVSRNHLIEHMLRSCLEIFEDRRESQAEPEVEKPM